MNEIYIIARVAQALVTVSIVARRAVDVLSLAFAALVAGSRTIPLGDNGALLRELAARTGRSGPRARFEPAR